MADVKGTCPYCGMKTFQFFMKMPSGKIKMRCEPSGYMDTDKPEKKYCNKIYYVKIEKVMVSMKH